MPLDEIEAQVNAVRSDFEVRAVETGMLGSTSVVETVTKYASNTAVPFVVVPVMIASSWDRSAEPEAEDAYEELIGEASIVTPNAGEAEKLTGIRVDSERSMQEAAEVLLDAGTDPALLMVAHDARYSRRSFRSLGPEPL